MDNNLINLVSFFSYVIITSFTPGPNNIMAMTNGTQIGFKKSLRFNFGVWIGFFIIVGLSILFSASMFKVIPNLKGFFKIVGFTYMIFLAFKILRSKPHDNKSIKNISSIKKGVILQFVNMKGVLYGITVTTVYITPYFTSPIILFLFAFFLGSIGFISTTCWSLFGSIFQVLFVKHYKILNICMSILLVYCAIEIIL